MIKPRNSLVVLKLIEKSERQVGKLVVPQNKECYTEAEVIAVGPGSVMADGARAETFDLKVGQRVWVKHKEKRGNPPHFALIDTGIPYTDNGITYHCFEQASIIGIIAEPGEAPSVSESAILLN